MDIHKPKAAHSIREFLIEIGTIVCGILIALGLEQGVEWLHKPHLRHEAREAIRGELSENLYQLRRRGEVQACVDARLGELETLLLSTQIGAKLPRPLWVGRPQVWSISDSRWLAAASSAGTALLPPNEQAAYAWTYSSMRSYQDEEKIEQLAWAHLRILGVLPSLDGEARYHLLEALQEARYANFRIKNAAAQATDTAKKTGVVFTPTTFAKGSQSVCIPMDTPQAEAMEKATMGHEANSEP
jgi:hypothetical protein